jgi:uncharacterized protein (TIGR03089 family)
MPAAEPRPVLTVADLLTGLLREPGRPRLTWYGADGERVELSGAVLDNWVSKSVNLLVQEFDIGPGSTVALDLPPHWRSVVWALAAWRCGATVRTGAEEPADALVTDRPGPAASRTAPLIVQSLPALARSWPGDLPPGAIDAAQAVMTYADTIDWVPESDPSAAALDLEDGRLAHGDLVRSAEAAVAVERGARTLLPTRGRRTDLAPLLLRALGVLASDGSLLFVLDGDQDRTDRIARDERVTAVG